MSLIAAALCLGVAGAAPLQAVPVDSFTLAWVHSVEKVEWRETWHISPAGLVAGEVRLRGSGAGMEPPPNARLVAGWYIYTPNVGPLPQIIVPDSPHSPPAILCAAECRPLRDWVQGGEGEAIRLAPCAGK